MLINLIYVILDALERAYYNDFIKDKWVLTSINEYLYTIY